MPQDQNPETPEMRTDLARLIAKGHVKDGTVPQDRVPLETAQMPVPVPAPAFRHVPDGQMWNIGDAVRDWVRAALSAMAQGERVGWDVSLTLAPADGGSFVSAYALVIYLPSVLLGQPPLGSVRIIPDHPNQNQVRQAVLSAVGELRDRQNQILKQGG